MLKDIELDQARQILLDQVSLLPHDPIGVNEAWGRVVAEQVIVPDDFPALCQAAVDGFALHGENLQGSSPIPIKEYLRFGDVPSSPLAPGEAVGVLTGVPVPPGTAAVVPYESVKVQNDTITLPWRIKPDLNIKKPGEDFKQGEIIAQPGKVINAGLISAMGAVGINQVYVYRKPKVAILGLTSNVVSSPNPFNAGQIIDSNGPLLKALLTRDGGEVIASSFPVNDEIKKEELLKEADVIITVGGTYATGDSEAVKLLRKWQAQFLFAGIKMKPGSHVGAGICDDKLILCLSGNPLACAVGYELLAAPLIYKMQGLPFTTAQMLATCTSSLSFSQQNIPRFIYGKADCGLEGWQVEILSGQKSSMIRPLIDGNVLIEIPAGQTGIAAGSKISIRLLGRW